MGADTRTVLVTGGAGYVGSHAVKTLTRAGYRVVVYDDLSAGHRAAAGGVELIVGDIRNVTAVRDAIRRSGASAVMHFAAWLTVSESTRDPVGYYRNNVVGALAVLESMVAESVSRLVFSSTCAVYGEPTEVPISEAHSTRPINAYGETKLAIERAFPHFEHAYGLQTISLRYFNAAGADPDGELGEDHDPEVHLIPLAIEAAIAGQPLEVFGDDYPTPDGSCLRDYIHVADLAEAHLLALRQMEETSRSATYNLGTGRPHSVNEVLAVVERVTGRPVPRTVAPRRPGDPAVLYASNEKAVRELRWRPRYADLETIVEHAWRWRQAHPRGYGDRPAP